MFTYKPKRGPVSKTFCGNKNESKSTESMFYKKYCYIFLNASDGINHREDFRIIDTPESFRISRAFIYWSMFYFMLTFTIKSIKIVIYATHYIQIAIQMVFNKEICMLIYVNQNNGEKMSCLKTNLNIKNINMNIKHLRKTIIKKPAHRNPFHQETRQKNPALHPAIYC